jgi:hypothetical protein
MARLSLQSWASIAEIAAAIVVVLSILYVGSELEQNARATRSESWIGINELLVQLDLTEATDPELSRFVLTAESTPEQVSPAEFWKFSRLAQARLGVFELSFLSLKNETLGDYNWKGVESYIAATVCKPGYRRFWADVNDGQDVYHPDFVSYINGVIGACQPRAHSR